MPDWYLFDTQQEAEAADAEISGIMGCPIDGINAATGAVDPNAQTIRWAEPRGAVEGWVIPVPDNPDHFIDAPTIETPTFEEAPVEGVAAKASSTTDEKKQ